MFNGDWNGSKVVGLTDNPFALQKSIANDQHTTDVLLGQIEALKQQVSTLSRQVEVQDKNPDKYFFPSQIAETIGFSANYISNLRYQGCHFHGRKTTIRHVRSFLARREGELV